MEYKNNESMMDILVDFIKQQGEAKNREKLVLFAQHYFTLEVFEELENRALEDLYGALLSHWNLFLGRFSGENSVHIYNPSVEECGWQSPHTVIEIITPDLPFIVQSVTMEINRYGFTNQLLLDTVYWVERSENGTLKDLSVTEKEGCLAECVLHIEIERLANSELIDKLHQSLKGVLIDVVAATSDWTFFLEKIETEIAILSAHDNLDLSESIAFLKWLKSDHFVFLGYREYSIIEQQGSKGFSVVEGSGLGILRDEVATLPAQNFLAMSDDSFTALNSPHPLMMTKATSKSTVYRSVFMDYIGIKDYDNKGQVVGEKRFLGLYASSAYSSELQNIPLVRSKIQVLLSDYQYSEYAHGERSLMYILNSLPRDELFQASLDDLSVCVMGVLKLQARQRVKVFVRYEVYGHFVSLLVFVPRERYNTESRKKIQAILLDIFKGSDADFSVKLTESILARIHFVIHSMEGCCINYDVNIIEQQIIAALSNWEDELASELLFSCGEAEANMYLHYYRDGFSAAYREAVSARTSVLDLKRFEKMQADGLNVLGILYSPLTADEHKQLYFKLYCFGELASLSNSLPMLENMGVKVLSEHPYEIIKQGEEKHFWIHDFGLEYADVSRLQLETLKPRFQKSFEQCWAGQTENDGFNALVVAAELEWRDVNIVRALFFYLRQIGMTFSQSYVESSLIRNATVVTLLVRLFYTRFDGQRKKLKDSSLYVNRINKAIEQVKSLDEDRILRRYLNLVLAAERTNFFENTVDERGIPYFAIKFKSINIEEIPSPVPYFEIFVYSPRFEGIHLRGGAVARGGLRWSDRREDFRTEVLGLMKAQMTKNAVIVPTGAKGGFVVKTECEDQDFAAEGLACYQIFIQALLDLTDNYKENKVYQPKDIHCYDEDEDSYLVVAADKGTARFSDYANALSKKAGFWLNDAFASGGSAGYDHKVMGITARGAWVSVQHHFDALGLDIKQQAFTVIGIGGMSGDVFGNGLLLSENIKLVAAFNHKSIFLDPNPDTQQSFKERERLFALENSGWDDYDTSLISDGGGVYSRKDKVIVLNDVIRGCLAIKTPQLSPNDLIKAILSAPVDLLWNGGIGTYVKAKDEPNSEVGDRANDALRINGEQLRCKVVGEGGNLGFTQRGRIEYALAGGAINTDSIDNSAGVDCSDHEVNIKILLNSIVLQGDMTCKQRDILLQSMTDEVAELVLHNNYQQNNAISMIQYELLEAWPILQQLIFHLEAEANLDRALEKLPDDKVLQVRKTNAQGLVRPEISVLLAYTKQMLKTELLMETGLIDLDLYQHALVGYFPKPLQETYGDAIQAHRLGKEIAANQLINSLVNRLGIVFPLHFMEALKCSAAELVNIYSTVCQLFDIDTMWALQCELDGVVEEQVLGKIKLRIRKLIEHSMYWFAYNEPSLVSVAHYMTSIKALVDALDSLMIKATKQQINEEVDTLILSGIGANLALKIAQSDVLLASLNAIKVYKDHQGTLEDAMRCLFYQSDTLCFDWLYAQILLLPKENKWDTLSKRAMFNEYNQVCGVLLQSILAEEGRYIEDKLVNWQANNQSGIAQYLALVEQASISDVLSLEKIVVLLSTCWKFTVYGN